MKLVVILFALVSFVSCDEDQNQNPPRVSPMEKKELKCLEDKLSFGTKKILRIEGLIVRLSSNFEGCTKNIKRLEQYAELIKNKYPDYISGLKGIENEN
ncbi:MAG: hypothetical protein HN509_03620 [Halobacteriovoraceae bacterium]|nr:hypothetical protein [Halobacteriovoraceae bacterium]MBT5093717.1 hypothetical protein [Halobacteriovoraceae bacterium]